MSKTSLLIHNQHNGWRTWQRFWAIFHKFHRRDDLENLTRWAQRKKLSGPGRYYSSLLADVEIDLNRYSLRQHRLSTWAYHLYFVCRLLKPRRVHYPRGSAANYGRC